MTSTLIYLPIQERSLLHGELNQGAGSSNVIMFCGPRDLLHRITANKGFSSDPKTNYWTVSLQKHHPAVSECEKTGTDFRPVDIHMFSRATICSLLRFSIHFRRARTHTRPHTHTHTHGNARLIYFLQ